MYRICILILPVLLSGCAGVFDFLIPKHSNSKAESPELICARFVHFPSQGEKKEMGALAAEAAMIAVGVVIDQVAKGLEAESKLYKATYSGRTSSALLVARKVEKVEFSLAEQGIKIQRFHGQLPANECPGIKQSKEEEIQKEEEAWKPYRVMQFEAKFESTQSLDTFRIIPTLFELDKTKAKVSWFFSEVDMNVQITLTGYIKDQEDKTSSKQIDLAQVDFPIGKLNISEKTNKTTLGHLASGSIAVPKPDASKLIFDSAKTPLSLLPINATITVMESDDFGDIIGKSSKTLTENKAKILDELGKLIRGKEAK